MILVIDDERTFDFDATYARSSGKALHYILAALTPEDGSVTANIQPITIDQLWLDHDLGGEDDIRIIVQALEQAGFNGAPARINYILIHTANPVARSWMRAGLEKYYNTFVVDAAHYVVSSE